MSAPFIEEKETKKLSRELFDGVGKDIDELAKENLNFNSEEDHINNFKIDTNIELPAFSTDFANAYAAVDRDNENDNEHYALVFKKNLPLRLTEIITFSTLKVEGIVLPKLYGLTKISNLGNEIYFVTIMPKPKGQSLKALMDNGIKFDESFLMGKILRPVLNTINHLHRNSITYGKINPYNIFIDEHGVVSLAEIISEACGHSQLTFYETTEMAQAQKFGKGHGNEKIDYYALGITLFTLTSGKLFIEVDPAETVKAKLYKGTYELLTNVGHVPNKISTLIKGLVIDNAEQRWGFTEVDGVLQGRVYSDKIIDTSFIPRAIIFNGKDFYSRKSLAFAMYQEWDLAVEFVKTDKIKKWLQSSASEEVVVEILHSVNFQIPAGKMTEARVFSIDDERLIRTLIMMDPDGPIRINNTSFHKDGMGLLFISSLNSGFADVVQVIAGALISNIFSSYEYISNVYGNQGNMSYLIPIYKCIEFISKSEVGFGIERCIYDLNPTLICQSNLVKEDFCLSGKDVLRCLEGKNASFEDIAAKKTLACFIASKLGCNVNYKLKELDKFPQIQKSKIFQLTNIFAIAQRQFKVGALSSLTLGFRDALKDILSIHIKGVSIKNSLFEQIDKAAQSGSIQTLITAAASPTMLAKNAAGFAKAVQRSSEIAYEIFSYSQKDSINKLIRQKSLRIVLQCSYVICSLILVTIILRSI